MLLYSPASYAAQANFSVGQKRLVWINVTHVCCSLPWPSLFSIASPLTCHRHLSLFFGSFLYLTWSREYSVTNNVIAAILSILTVLNTCKYSTTRPEQIHSAQASPMGLVHKGRISPSCSPARPLHQLALSRTKPKSKTTARTKSEGCVEVSCIRGTRSPETICSRIIIRDHTINYRDGEVTYTGL